MITKLPRVLTAIALVLGLAGSIHPSAAALPPGVRLAGTTVVTSSGSSVVGAVLDRAVTIPASGLDVKSWRLSDTTWAAVVLARQPIPGRVPVAPYFVGSAYVSAGGSARTTLPMFGQAPLSPSGTAALQLPAGSYAVYLLTDPEGTATAEITIPGLTGSVTLHGQTWVDAHVSTMAATAGVDAAAAGSTAESAPSESAIVMLAATSGDPVAHDLALCLLRGPASTGKPSTEDVCGTPAQSSVAASRSTGPLGGAATAIAPVVAKGSYATAFHLRVVGPGSAAAVTVLRWTWTWVQDALPDCRSRDLTARTTTPRADYRAGETVRPKLLLTNRGANPCALPALCPPAWLDVRDSHGRAVPYPRPGYACPMLTARNALKAGGQFSVPADEWDATAGDGRFTISAHWWLLSGEPVAGSPAVVTVH